MSTSMNSTVTRRLISGVTASVCLLSAVPASAATFTLFTDQAAFEASLSTSVTEDFNGPASDFGANTANNAIGTQTSVTLVGGVGDTGPTGLTGTGFFQGEVDSSEVQTQDGLSLEFSTGTIYGLGFVGLQNDDGSDPGSLDLEEIGISIDGTQFLVSDILGLTNSASGQLVATVENTEPVFVGILSDMPFDGFTLLQGDFVAPGEVDGNNEEFFLDALILATSLPDVNTVPLPAGLPLLLAGLGSLAALRRRA